MKKEAEANAEADAKQKEEADKVNAADQLIFQTEKSLADYGDKIPEDKKKPIEDALAELKDLEAGRDSQVFGEVGGDYTAKQISRGATSFVSRIIIKEIVERTITKKAVGLVPGLGAVFSGGFNYVYMKDVGDAAYMIYRERFLLDKKGRKRTISIDIE